VTRAYRNSHGQQISEFGAALAILFVVIFIPFLDLGILPIRYFLAKEIIGNYARKLSLCETYTQALSILNSDPSMENQLIKLGGVKPRQIRCNLIISSTKTGERYVAEGPKRIPGQWLPNGYKSPCDYAVQVSAEVDISPVVLVKGLGAKTPGLNCPVSFTIASEANWENLGCDPVTKVFFVNE
jgi:hypothetical protein